jgi:GNAT superfamily N-acetyltransferase
MRRRRVPWKPRRSWGTRYRRGSGLGSRDGAATRRDAGAEAGRCYTTPDRTAAALWIPGTGPAEPPEDCDEELAEVTGQWAGRFVTFDGELDAHHLDGVAHHHLAILAVRPDWQGRGLGTALLDAHHALLDKEGAVAYLEASDERTRGIYLRHGYADYGSPIQLPDGPPMYPMTREPRGGGG